MKVLILTALLSVLAPAQTPKLPGHGWKPLLQGEGLAGWHAPGNQPTAWYRASGVSVKEAPGRQLLAMTGRPGPLLVNGPDGRTTQLVTGDRFGDLELYLEFLIPAKSNSGIYVAGLYEVQILDSFGVEHPGVHDCGAIYERWINEKGAGGTAPLVNASKHSGEWQTFHIWFQAPRFDSAGKKVADARFSKVELNGKVIQRDVAAPGPTRASLDIPEAARNPIMLQGDHGPVAFRNMYIRSLEK